MACSLMAPSHYLNNYWLIVKRILWHSPEGNFTKVLMNLIGNTCLKATLKLSPHPPVTTELNGPRKITMGKNTSWTHLKVARFYILYIGISNQLIKWGQLRAWFIFSWASSKTAVLSIGIWKKASKSNTQRIKINMKNIGTLDCIHIFMCYLVHTIPPSSKYTFALIYVAYQALYMKIYQR